eukprot:scpid22564/ scgid5898/ Anaphase-promoting complex subunit 4; Cyclosome subunit 4
MEVKAFHYLTDKHISVSAKSLEWSPKFDLVLMVSREGSVSLHRSSTWQKIWEICPDAERTGAATSVCWRPDGRVVAIGHERGHIRIFTLENAVLNGVAQGPACVHEIIMTSSHADEPREQSHRGAAVSCLEWFVEQDGCHGDRDKTAEYVQTGNSLQPEVPNVAVQWFGEQRDGSCRRELGLDSKECLLPQDNLDMLVVGTCDGTVSLYLCGLLRVCELRHDGAAVADVCLSSDWSQLAVICAASGQKHSDASSTAAGSSERRHVHDVSAIVTRRPELVAVCQLYGVMMSLCDYITWSIQIIIDSWEDVMEQINEKLSAMATELGNSMGEVKIGSVLLRLLVRGTLPWQAAVFLERELSEGALYRVSTRLTSCYETIRATVVSSLQPVLLYLMSKCQDALGFASFHCKFACLGLDATAFRKCMNAVATLTLKCSELISVMLMSSKDIESFLAWLTCASSIVQSTIKTKSDPDAVKYSMTRSQLCSVGKFISASLCCESDPQESNMEPIKTDRSGTSLQQQEQQFNIEKVGQYLRDKPLTSPYKQPVADNDNDLLLELRSVVEQFDWSYTHDPSTSLVQDFRSLTSTVTEAFAAVVPAFNHLLSSGPPLALPSGPVCQSSCYVPHRFSSASLLEGQSKSGIAHVALHDDSISVVLITHSTRALNVYFADESTGCRYGVVDAQWYSEKQSVRARYTLTVLLSVTDGSAMLGQLHLERLLGHFAAVDATTTRLCNDTNGSGSEMSEVASSEDSSSSSWSTSHNNSSNWSTSHNNSSNWSTSHNNSSNWSTSHNNSSNWSTSHNSSSNCTISDCSNSKSTNSNSNCNCSNSNNRGNNSRGNNNSRSNISRSNNSSRSTSRSNNNSSLSNNFPMMLSLSNW